MQKIIVSMFLFLLIGCATKPELIKDPTATVLTPEKIAQCIVTVDTKLPDYLDLSSNRLEKLEVDGDNVMISKTEFLSVQDLLLKLKNRIYELQEIIKDSRK